MQALTKTGFNRARAARLLGLTRRALGYRIQKYGLEAELNPLRDRSSTLPLPFPASLPAA